jgi:hypothetical protein
MAGSEPGPPVVIKASGMAAPHPAHAGAGSSPKFAPLGGNMRSAISRVRTTSTPPADSGPLMRRI